MQFTKTAFGNTRDGEPVSLYRLENQTGACLEVLDYGCRIRSLTVPDRNGALTDVILGYSELSDYETDTTGQGAVIGRHANRIRNASFTLNGKVYDLEKNDGNNHLHGGKYGFAFRVWKCAQEDNKLIFTRSFPDGEGNYPGNLDVKVTYEWTEDNRLLITYEAVSDADTIFNPTNHSYFNLEGAGSSSVLDHELMIFSSSMTESDPESLPNGTILTVEGTPFDFRQFKTIGQDIGADHFLLKYGNGYDHNYILEGQGFCKAAILQSQKTGIRMTCSTDEPGIQLYTGNFLDGTRKDTYGRELSFRRAVCLETQHYPNSMEHPEFPSIVLKAGQEFVSKTWYEFDTI